MSLLAPLFLLGLLALAVPVFVHLLHRERRQAQPFPSLMFLRRIPFRSVRRQKLRHLLLFALRSLAVVLLATAFARPFLGGAAQPLAAAGGARALVLAFDRSYSMGYEDRFERARQAALSALQGLSPADEAGLILFAEQAEGVVPLTREHARVRAALEAARLSASATRFAPALKLAQEWLSASDKPRLEARLISDCQKRGLEGLDELRFPRGAELTVVDVGERSAPSNAAIVGVAFDRETASGRERIAVTARVAHKGEKPATRRLRLEIAGRVVEEKPLALPASGAASVSFAPVPYPAGAARGRVLASDDGLVADDVFHFVLAPGQELSVLLVEDSGAGPYLRRALAIGDRPRFRAESRPLLTPEALQGRALVILSGSAPSDPAGAALADFVRRGGGLIAALGGGAAWRGPAALLLPGTPGALRDRTAERGASLAFLELEHPALELFKAPRSGDFSAARFLRYRALEVGEGSRVLARFDDGSVALCERQEQKGRVIAFASGFDALSNDLALQPVFLPLVHQLARYAAGHHENPLFRRVGEVLALEKGDGGQERGPAVTTPAGDRVRLQQGRMAVELLEAGFYEVQRPGAGAVVVAANVDTAESDLASVDAEELQSALSRRAPAQAAGADTPQTPEDQERRQSLWWYLLAAAFLLLLAETAFANRLSPAVTGPQLELPSRGR